MKKALAVFLGIAVILTVMTGLQASTLTGIYALVEEVKVMEDLSGIKIYGVFKGAAREDGPASSIFLQAERGWISFSIPEEKDKRQISLIEWGDLKRIAAEGEKKCIAFGSRLGVALDTGSFIFFRDNKRTFVWTEEPKTPHETEYPVDHGMHVLHSDSKICRELKAVR